MSHSGYVVWEYVAFGVMFFGIMSHSALCLIRTYVVRDCVIQCNVIGPTVGVSNFCIGTLSYTYPLRLTQLYSRSARCNVHNGWPPPGVIKFSTLGRSICTYCTLWFNPGLWIQIRIDLHSFYLLDPDPGGKIVQIKTKKGKEIANNCSFIQFLT